MNLRVGPWGRRPAAAAPAEDRPDSTESDAAPSHYPCPNCGALLGYRPGERHLVCAFCGAETDIDPAAPEAAGEALRERDFEAALRGEAEAAPIEETRVARCDACGARVEFSPDEHAATCPFCATAIVGDPAPDRHIRPQALLPFAIDAEEARSRIARWLGGLWFAPSGLKDYARMGKALSGIYAPYWTFDARADAAYSGERGDVYYVTIRGAKGRTQQVARVRWRPAHGRVSRSFDDVLALGSASLPREDAEGIGPWDLSALQPYARDWLAGFRAEAYTIGLREAWGDARVKIDRQLLIDIKRDIGGDRQRVRRIDTKVEGVTFKHVLLPIWVGAYRWRGRPFRLLVNGRTGAVRGERPWSAWKIALAALAALIVGGAAAWIIAQGRG